MLKVFAIVIWCSSLVLGQATLNVSAAISLKEVLEKSADEFKSKNNADIQFNYDATGMQAALLQQGIPSSLFICSHQKKLHELIEKGILDKDSVKQIAGNELVLITPAANKSITSFQDLSKDDVKKIAIGEPSTEPAGEYASQTFKSLKMDGDVMTKLVYGANVRKVLEYVEKGEVDAGIVYRTDAIVSGDKVRVVSVADETWHDPIEFHAAIVAATGDKELAKKYIDYLSSDALKELCSKQGFAVRHPSTQPASVPASLPASAPVKP